MRAACWPWRHLAWSTGRAISPPQGGEYNITGALVGDQVYPQASVKTTGGYVVWQDNFTDGSGLGISARKLDSSLSGSLSTFRVNENGADDQERAAVSMLNDGGAVFVWQGGKQSFQHIYARVRSAGGVWTTGDIQVNTPTDVFQREAAVTTLANGNAVVVWGSYNQASATSYQDVYSQILTPAGVKAGGETRVNATTAFNQRSAAIAPLSDGRYVVVWVSEQQRFENSVDVLCAGFQCERRPGQRRVSASTPALMCARAPVSPRRGTAVLSWRGCRRTFKKRATVGISLPGHFPARATRGRSAGSIPTCTAISWGRRSSAVSSTYLVVWTSMAQDGSGNGVYGQLLASDGASSAGEFRVNATTPSEQMHPVVASDGVATFLTVWTGFIGGANSFDLFAQRYASTDQPLSAPGTPMVTVLSSNALSVSWPPVEGFSVTNYEVYADGAMTATAVVTNTYWTATGLHAGQHPQLPSGLCLGRWPAVTVVRSDGRIPPTVARLCMSGIPAEVDGSVILGEDCCPWLAPYADSDGDGASNQE
ncbi:MAG: fibronectin type III domain-containing protein [Verrucomicrobiota bacterium]